MLNDRDIETLEKMISRMDDLIRVLKGIAASVDKLASPQVTVPAAPVKVTLTK